MRRIIERKLVLDSKYNKEINPEKKRKALLQMLKMASITDRMNKDGLLDDLIKELKET